MTNPLRKRHHENKLGRMRSTQRLRWLSSSYGSTLATKLDDAQVWLRRDRYVVNCGEGLMSIDFSGHVSLAEKEGVGMQEEEIRHEACAAERMEHKLSLDNGLGVVGSSDEEDEGSGGRRLGAKGSNYEGMASWLRLRGGRRRAVAMTVVCRTREHSKSTSQEESDGSDVVLVHKKTLVESSPVEPQLTREMVTERRHHLCGMEGWATTAKAVAGVGGKQQRHHCCAQLRATVAANDNTVVGDRGEIGASRWQ
ncbi:hypothetical protein B296_00058625 [Ensete ventricosum]|uniref:Uncharacterized protein n=1 Tax=Ensete ventricosum TaxID=4639 RepID=A0A426WZD6_ENSVE|nr:hypothetical protein B296_00058625 [Ensete ventricosum]